MRVIGTAGHVDHGKSTLIEALTGNHPDRLKEEQEREMTIDLGFGWWTLPDGEELGVVDVPGHRDFIENMLAGVGGIDAVLFVIAADEGIMPQTREHLAILDLLKVNSGIIVITKIDMVDDEEWTDLVEEEILAAVAGTVLENAPILRVSAKAGNGLKELESSLVEVLKAQPVRLDLDRPRLAVDRTFTIKGFGTVATGTLLDGVLNAGDEVEILPSARKARIRGLQTHKRKVEVVQPGSRTAINLTGIDLDEIQRGDVIAKPGIFRPTGRIDVQFDLLSDASHPLKHNDEVKFFIGTSERIARVRLIGKEILQPGESGWLQIEMKEPVVCYRGDRFILRRPSPGETIGGGSILEPYSKYRYKRFDERIQEKFSTLEKGDPEHILLDALSQTLITNVKELKASTALPNEAFETNFSQLLEKNQVVLFDRGQKEVNDTTPIIGKMKLNEISGRMSQLLDQFHIDNPLRIGIPLEEIDSRLKISKKASQLLQSKWREDPAFFVDQRIIRLPEFEISFSSKQQSTVDELIAAFNASPFSPPTFKTCVEMAGEEIVVSLIDQGILLRYSQEVLFHKRGAVEILESILKSLQNGGTITAAEARDVLGTTRRYALAILEYYDRIGLSRREGDSRTLSPKFQQLAPDEIISKINAL